MENSHSLEPGPDVLATQAFALIHDFADADRPPADGRAQLPTHCVTHVRKSSDSSRRCIRDVQIASERRMVVTVVGTRQDRGREGHLPVAGSLETLEAAMVAAVE